MFYPEVVFYAEFCRKIRQMKKIVIQSILYLIAVMPLVAYAHASTTRQSGVDIALPHNLKGVVVDENKTPIGFANVVLLKADSTYIAGTVTDENGFFVFNENWNYCCPIKLR